MGVKLALAAHQVVGIKWAPPDESLALCLLQDLSEEPQQRMQLCGLPKARPISCNDCPDFQRLQTSVLCVRESLDRFPSLINTILKQHVYQMVLHRPIESTAVIGHMILGVRVQRKRAISLRAKCEKVTPASEPRFAGHCARVESCDLRLMDRDRDG